MFLGAPGRLPLDRYLAMPITVGMGLVLMAMVFSGRKKKPA
jgi:hypothetical protein